MLSHGESQAVSQFVRALGHSVLRMGGYFGRRKFLEGSFFTIILFASKKTRAIAKNDANFLRASCFLTGRDVDKNLAKHFFAALFAQDAEFAEKVARLDRSIALQAPMSIDALDINALSSADQTCALTIISAWYTGMVGAGPAAVVVTFRSAFLYDATRDAVVVPSYCLWKANYWTQAPPPAPMTGFTAPRFRFPIWFRW